MPDDDLSIFGNLPRLRRGPDDDDSNDGRLTRARYYLTMQNLNFEGPLGQRPRRPGVGGPSVVPPPVPDPEEEKKKRKDPDAENEP